MGEQSRLEEMLSLWEGQWAQGRDVLAAELCRDRPELLAELEQSIGQLRQLGRLVQKVNVSHPVAAVPQQPDFGPGLGETQDAHAGAVSVLPVEAAPPGYEILGELGRGGMGVVYKARQRKADRLVALKMILAGGHAGPDQLARFRTEAEAIARLQHSHVVQIFEVGEHQGLPFFSLEFCPGGSLDKKLAGTPLPPTKAAALVEKLARAMQAAHEAKILHRDLKLANVLLAADGAPKITDFGLAKSVP
jgi:serine/threonine protein kinase